MASKQIARDQAFGLGDLVETDFSGKPTKHIISGRFTARNSQSGVVYTLTPPVPKSGGAQAKIDHAWFKRILSLNETG